MDYWWRDSTGISEITSSKSDISIYQNSVTDVVNLKTSNDDAVNLEVHDLSIKTLSIL